MPLALAGQGSFRRIYVILLRPPIESSGDPVAQHDAQN